MAKILIVGGGYTGFYTALKLQKRLRRGEAEVTLVDPLPYMTYHPFLPEVAAGLIEARHVIVPLRRHLTKTHVVQGRVVNVNHAKKTATIEPSAGKSYTTKYDHIVIAAGSVSRTFPVPGIAEEAFGMKSIEEAIAVRDRIIDNFAKAANLPKCKERDRLLTVTVIGGGFAGIETFAELRSLASAMLPQYPELTIDDTKFHLVEAMSLSVVGKRLFGVTWPRFKDFGPILVVWAVSMLVLIFQRDLGTSLLYFGLFLVLMYVATGRAIWLVVGGGLFGLGALIAHQFLPYVQGRVDAWLDSFNQSNYEAVGGSYQLVQGLFGFASGGIIGTGLGAGYPGIVPLAESDYIMASLGEELGLVGIFAILALYLLFVARGIRIGINGSDDFGRLLAVGLTFVIALQVFIVVGGVTRVIPVTGLTTPFLAAGGSSLVANWIIVALLLRLSDTVRHQREAADA